MSCVGVGSFVGNDPLVYAQINPVGEDGAGYSGVRIVGDDCPLYDAIRSALLIASAGEHTIARITTILITTGHGFIGLSTPKLMLYLRTCMGNRFEIKDLTYNKGHSVL
jgi:hypothetical protein